MGGLVLVVDDDSDVRSALKETLEDAGYDVAIARTGAEGLAQLREGLRPAAVLVDVVMPMMDGWQFLAQLEADATLPAGVPIIMLSATPPQGAHAPRVAGFLAKPFSLETLLAELTRCVT
jgi:CheY-like chemotaxis protein